VSAVDRAIAAVEADLAGLPRGKVLCAMSGGVDSSVAAALLQRLGFEVVGCFMRLGSPGETLDEPLPDGAACEASPGPAGQRVKIGHQGCCSINDAADARLVAAQLGVAFYVCNFKNDFARIIDYFVDEYARGRTPNPCVRCNDWLKFGKLHDYAQQIGARFVASGHYARVDRAGGTPRLLPGFDAGKDQSYVLFGAPRERLSDMLLPIGALEKPLVRAVAQELGLPVFDKPDSQEICFVPDNDYAGLVERRRPALARAGPIVDAGGRVVGEHAGQHRFTIGQRRGTGVALGRPVFVVARDPAANTVTIGDEADLFARSCLCAEANWLVDPPSAGLWLDALARVRAHGELVSARVRRLPDLDVPDGPSGRTGAFEVVFDEPHRAVAPGQAVVLHDRETPHALLAGGWIARVRAPERDGGPPRGTMPA
jgi:tRNA-specific 2-thiouridylase